MSSKLTPNESQQLAPLLGSLARLIAKKSRIDDDLLTILIGGTDLPVNPNTINELQRWASLLEKVYLSPDESTRSTVIETLKMRGLEEAPVLLAVAEVTEGQGSIQSESKLKVSNDYIQLGQIQLGEKAVGEFSILDGGPGNIYLKNGQISVTPSTFGKGKTRIQVELAPQSGELFFTDKIQVINESGECAIINVSAEWVSRLRKKKIKTKRNNQPSVAPLDDKEDNSEIVLSSDGINLADAINRARPGQTICLGAGIYHLAQPLLIDKPLILLGAGIDQTIIRGDSGQYILKYSSDGQFKAREIRFEYQGSQPADCFRADLGDVYLTRCHFTGAKGLLATGTITMGTGVRLAGTVNGWVENCRSENNDGYGIYVGGQATSTLEANSCQENKEAGIDFGRNVSGAARQNYCNKNGKYGIFVGEQAAPTLEGNTCQENKNTGIGYWGSASGIARQNICIKNENYGIYVGEQAAPTLEGNTCQENKQVGIAYSGSSSGTAQKNVCNRNDSHGIDVRDHSNPMVEANICEENVWNGIAYFGNTSGTSRNNTCNKNKNCGIYISDQAAPLLEANTCQFNKWRGIAYFGNASGLARKNICNTNEDYGIYIGDAARPVLESNDCHYNKTGNNYP